MNTLNSVNGRCWKPSIPPSLQSMVTNWPPWAAEDHDVHGILLKALVVASGGDNVFGQWLRRQPPPSVKLIKIRLCYTEWQAQCFEANIFFDTYGLYPMDPKEGVHKNIIPHPTSAPKEPSLLQSSSNWEKYQTWLYWCAFFSRDFSS